MANTLSFRVLGPLEMRVHGQKIKPGGPRQNIILAILILAEGRVVSVDFLAEAIWGHRPPVTSRTQVSIGVAGLRKIIRSAGWESDLIVTASPGYQLVADGVSLDSAEFSNLVRESQQVLRDGNAHKAVDLLNEGLALWRGRAFAGIISQLVEAESADLEEQRLLAYETRSSTQLLLGRHLAAAAELTPFVRENPLRERARGDLMRAHYLSGRRAEALAVFREGRSHLVKELGIEPGPDLQKIHDAILRDEIPSAVDCTPSSQIVALPTPAQIPPAPPYFVGREQEMALLDTLLETSKEVNSPAFGLITGGPGSGKTTLATHWAHSVASHFPDGLLFANLSGCHGEEYIDRTDQILEVFLSALGFAADQLPPSRSARTALYRSVLYGRRVLILLDNVADRAQLAPLLPGSGTCGVLVTSRSSYCEAATGNETLHLRLGELSNEASTAMMETIIGTSRTAEDPAGISRLVALCEGLPLALQSATAQLLARPHWTASHLAKRVEDERRINGISQLDRQLDESFTGTYNRLSRSAASAFRQVAKFDQGEFSVATAAAFMGLDLFAAEELLEQLVDVHLLYAVSSPEYDESYYRISSLLRVYAKSHADDSLLTISTVEMFEIDLSASTG
ncbi:SARP family transcriptional regulator, regulator of embCAB operon [Frankia sp. AiPs1]|uniref:AfsR/SARP family transcriptional regulator n=1 Tax=Frankia sp. AiPa1 TaxID=573492 RepID=UPI00202AEA47|nr:BTAD domain-containing putative transcriptional regulator [Frankia sp. AiPa1]MCL9758118.1 NB-ARC domain-containing protein [Frankia sp. AiPa1]